MGKKEDSVEPGHQLRKGVPTGEPIRHSRTLSDIVESVSQGVAGLTVLCGRYLAVSSLPRYLIRLSLHLAVSWFESDLGDPVRLDWDSDKEVVFLGGVELLHHTTEHVRPRRLEVRAAYHRAEYRKKTVTDIPVVRPGVLGILHRPSQCKRVDLPGTNGLLVTCTRSRSVPGVSGVSCPTASETSSTGTSVRRWVA